MTISRKYWDNGIPTWSANACKSLRNRSRDPDLERGYVFSQFRNPVGEFPLLAWGWARAIQAKEQIRITKYVRVLATKQFTI
jgi:hypothetical protein